MKREWERDFASSHRSLGRTTPRSAHNDALNPPLCAQLPTPSRAHARPGHPFFLLDTLHCPLLPPSTPQVRHAHLQSNDDRLARAQALALLRGLADRTSPRRMLCCSHALLHHVVPTCELGCCAAQCEMATLWQQEGSRPCSVAFCSCSERPGEVAVGGRQRVAVLRIAITRNRAVAGEHDEDCGDGR